MLQLLSPSWPAGVVTVSVPTVGRFGRWFRWGAGTAVCALAAAGVGCGSGLEGDGGATLRDAGASASGRAATGRRVALVVGNNAYSGQSELYNAVNDARAVASALSEESVGFAVTKLEDATRAELTSALSAFARSLREDDVALFYFAGHGVQVDGINYLMPVDHEGQTEEAVRLDALSAASVEEMLQPARVAMLVFDACRNNPYRGMRGGTGLAPMEARGTLIAYAAGAGEVAADSAPGASNGLFTSKFVEALRVPGLTAADLFRRVRREVVTASNEGQWPAVYDDLLSDFVFRPAAAVAAGASEGPAPVTAENGASSPVPAQRETVFWQSIQDSADAADFEAYLELFPSGTFTRLARNRLAALRGAADAPRPAADPPRRRRPGDVFRDCAECPEMVVLPGGGLALGRYEVTVGEYRAFVSARGTGNDEWRDVSFPQTDRHPVVNVSSHDAQRYVSWLSHRTGATYRLPTEAEWDRAAAGSQPGCDRLGRVPAPAGTCPVGTNGTNAAGLSDMVGNVWEWTSDCWGLNCRPGVLRGGAWNNSAGLLRRGARARLPFTVALRSVNGGFRVSRTLD